MRAVIHLCGPKVYEYNGVEFEFGYCGPWRLKKNGDPTKLQGVKWMDKIATFLKMSEADQATFRTGGGCQCFTTRDAP